MEEPNDVVRVAEFASFEAGKVDAVLAAVVGILRATQSIPEISDAVLQSLAEAYPSEGARAENLLLVQGFDEVRDQILSALRKGR
jgi:hypothetical protein